MPRPFGGRSAVIAVLACLAALPSRAGIGSSLLSFRLTGAGAHVGTAVAVAGDVNGDGYSDLIVGAPLYGNGQSQEGEVLLFPGGPNGYAPTPSWTFESNLAGANVGQSVAPAGDVNGDGFADVIVGAPKASTGGLTSNGRAYVFLGGPSGLASAPAWTFDGTQAGEQLGWSVCTAGDVNGDGYDDVIVGSPNYNNIAAPAYRAQATTSIFNNGRTFMFLGSASGPAVSPSWTHAGFQAGGAFGFSVSTAGDINGDGYDDVIVGAPYGTNLFNGHANAGEIDVFHGGSTGLPATPSVTRYGSQANELHGYSVGAAGDVDGDGYAEVVVGSPGYTDVVTSQGAVYIYPGSNEGIQGASFLDEGPVASATLPGGQLGYCVAPAGDINGDGYADFIAGAPFYSSSNVTGIYVGYVAVYEGTTQSNGQLNGYHARLAYSSSFVHGSEFGTSVCAGGDGNGDGFGDVVVGAPTFAVSDGTVLAFGGAADAPSTMLGQIIDIPPSKLDPTSPSPPFPVSGGDIDGDGYGDLLVYLNPTDLTEIFRGGPGGLATSPAWSIHSSDVNAAAAEGFPMWVGDVNGDGYDDLQAVVGKKGATIGDAYVLAGSPTGPVLPPLTSFGPLAKLFPIGDVNGDGYADIMGIARVTATPDSLLDTVYVYLGGPSGPLPAPSQTLMINHDWLPMPWVSLGDYNGDGYGDMLINNLVYSATYNEQGRLQLFTGSASGLSPNPAVKVLGTGALDHIAVRPVGDLNGDGLADFAVFGAVTPLTFYYGNSALPPTVMSGNGYRSSGDFNGDGLEDVVLASGSATRVYLGTTAGLSTSPTASLTFPQYPWESASISTGSLGLGDFNGDGFGDVANVVLTYSTLGVDTAHVQIVYGNEGVVGAPGLDRAANQRRVSDAALIGLLGTSDSPTQFRLASRGRSAAGRTRVRMESDVKNWGVAFESNLGSLIHDAWTPTGDPGALGTFAALDAVRALPTSGPTDKWRMRIAAHSPYFPWTPWLSPPGNGRYQYDLRNASSVAGVSDGAVPAGVELAPPSPNPSRGEAHLAFALPRQASVELGIYDVSGRRIATLASGRAEAGPHEMAWSGRTDSGRPAGPGLYFARLTTEGHVITQKIVRTE